jgi:hypothetical protein
MVEMLMALVVMSDDKPRSYDRLMLWRSDKQHDTRRRTFWRAQPQLGTKADPQSP